MNAGAANFSWYLYRDGQQHGPISHEEIHKLVQMRRLRPADMLWREGFADWVAWEAVAELQPRQPAPLPPPPASRPPQAAQPQGGDRMAGHRQVPDRPLQPERGPAWAGQGRQGQGGSGLGGPGLAGHAQPRQDQAGRGQAGQATLRQGQPRQGVGPSPAVYAQPGHPPSGHGQSGYGQPGHGQPGYGQPGRAPSGQVQAGQLQTRPPQGDGVKPHALGQVSQRGAGPLQRGERTHRGEPVLQGEPAHQDNWGHQGAQPLQGGYTHQGNYGYQRGHAGGQSPQGYPGYQGSQAGGQLLQASDGTHDEPYDREVSTTLPMVAYILCLVPIPPLPLIGLILSLVNTDAKPEWLATHYRWQWRTVVKSIPLAILGSLLVPVFGIGILVLIGVVIWQIVRLVKGIGALNRREPVENYRRWGF